MVLTHWKTFISEKFLHMTYLFNFPKRSVLCLQIIDLVNNQEAFCIYLDGLNNS